MRISYSSTMASPECSEYFTVGAQVRFITANRMERKGEVVAFDYNTKMLLIKRPSVGQHGLFDLECVNLDLVRKLECTEEPQSVPDPLPVVPAGKLSKRIKDSVFERKQLLNLVGVDVSPEGQLLMNSISKTITEVRWDKETIVVMNVVSITPPYTTVQCQLIAKDSLHNQQNQHTLAHIRKIVEKHQKDEQLRQGGPGQNDTRRSMSPSPATSSSSTSSAS